MSKRLAYLGRDENDQAVWVEHGSAEHIAHLEKIRKPLSQFIPDEGDFVSPIDGKIYSGKAGMREHNARHDVVNNRDLVGLRTGFSGVAPPSDRRQLRSDIIAAARSKGYFNGK